MSDRAAIDYAAACTEIFSVLTTAWNDEDTGAQSIALTVFGDGNDYLPVLRTPGDRVVEDRNVALVMGKAAYQTITDTQSSFRNGNETRKYTATGMLGVQILCPKNVAKAYVYGRLLARLVQKAFRNPPSGGSVWYRDQRIIEVGSVQNDNQINIFVTASYETEE
jgi:hypothetical protein